MAFWGVGALGPELALCKNTYRDRAKLPPAFFEKLILVTIILQEDATRYVVSKDRLVII